MAPTAAPRDRRCPLPFLLLLLLPGPAPGNEGGAAGSCRCQRRTSPPPFPERLESCDTCHTFARFNFPQRRVCGLKEEPWVINFQNFHCRKGDPEGGAGRAKASQGHHRPAPTSPTAGPASLTSPSPDKSQGVSWGPAMTGSPPEPSAEAAAGEANRAPLEEEEVAPPSAPDAKTSSITAVLFVGLVVGSVSAAVLGHCWWRRQCSRSQAGQRPQAPLPEEEEGTLCLPGENT